MHVFASGRLVLYIHSNWKRECRRFCDRQRIQTKLGIWWLSYYNFLGGLNENPRTSGNLIIALRKYSEHRFVFSCDIINIQYRNTPNISMRTFCRSQATLWGRRAMDVPNLKLLLPCWRNKHYPLRLFVQPMASEALPEQVGPTLKENKIFKTIRLLRERNALN